MAGPRTTDTNPSSLTHQHVAAAVATECAKRPALHKVTLLDAGCGEGRLLQFLAHVMPEFSPVSDWELFGFDVVDSTSRRPDFPEATVRRLSEAVPCQPWQDRIRAVPQAGPWPFPDDSMDMIVSNQVLEHVVDAAAFLQQVRRVLAPGGVCINVFPLADALYEGHLLVPLAAQVRGFEQRAAWLRLMYRLGFGASGKRAGGAAMADQGSDYVHFATHYRTWADFVSLAKPLGLRLSYRYTLGLYAQKLRRLTGRPLPRSYQAERNALVDFLVFSLARRLSSVTLVLERPEPGSRFDYL